jgi:pSer/pThr/pTyr-binding forkhead associated (FHA) protein
LGKLTVTTGPAAGQAVEVDRELTIGRENVDLAIEDEEISRRHAAVRPVPNGIAIRDLGSQNGTFVNGERVERETTLRSSGTLRIGTTEITVELPAPTTVVSPDVTAPAESARDVDAQRVATRAAVPATVVGPAPASTPPPRPPRAAGTAAGAAASSGGRRSSAAALLRRPWIPLLAAALVAGVIVAIVFAVDSDNEKSAPTPQKHAISGTLHGALLSMTRDTIRYAGEVEQKPGGKGAFTGSLRVLVPPISGRPVPMMALATERFDGGRIDLRFTGTLQCLSRNCAKRIVRGVGPVMHATGAFAGARGKLSIFAHAERATQGTFTIKGSIIY